MSTVFYSFIVRSSRIKRTWSPGSLEVNSIRYVPSLPADSVGLRFLDFREDWKDNERELVARKRSRLLDLHPRYAGGLSAQAMESTKINGGRETRSRITNSLLLFNLFHVTPVDQLKLRTISLPATRFFKWMNLRKKSRKKCQTTKIKWGDLAVSPSLLV